MHKLIVIAALIVAPVAGVAGAASAATPVCRDTNGSRPGGSVYVAYGRPLNCDLTPPQRLHETRVPSRAACDDMGGHGWTSRFRICWDRDY